MFNRSKSWHVENDFYIRYARLRYIAFRLIYRLLYGKRKRDAILAAREIDFTNFIPEGVYKGKFYRAHVRKKTDDFVQLFHYREESLQKYFYLTGPKPVYVDLGANVGRYVLQFASLYHDAICIAIEAHPRTYAALQNNIKANPDLASRIFAFNYAVTDGLGRVKIYERILDNGVFSSAHSSMVFDFGSQNFLEVQSNTLDNILSASGIKYDEIDLIKIDIEGAELTALKGATETLSRTNRLIIETHGDNPKPVLEFMQSQHYRIEKVSFGDQIYLICNRMLEETV